MTRLQQISLGIKTYFDAVAFIFKNGLLWTLLIPVILNLLFFWGSFELIAVLNSKLDCYLASLQFLQDGIFENEILRTGFHWLLKTFSSILIFIIAVFLSGYVIMILLSPLLSYLSEKTEKIIKKTDFPFRWKQFFYDIFRGIKIALRNIFLELFFTLLVLLLMFIPLLAWLIPIILFLLASYFYGFSYFDYNNERHRKSIKERIHFVRKHKYLAITNGSIFSLVLFIPFVGIMLGCFMAIFSTVAAALAYHEIHHSTLTKRQV